MIYEQFQFVDAPLLNRCKEFRNTLFEYRIGISDPVILHAGPFTHENVDIYCTSDKQFVSTTSPI